MLVYAGMLTITDFIKILQKYYKHRGVSDLTFTIVSHCLQHVLMMLSMVHQCAYTGFNSCVLDGFFQFNSVVKNRHDMLWDCVVLR